MFCLICFCAVSLLRRSDPSLSSPGNPESLEGVAYAVLQLWEKCEVVRIDAKKGSAHVNLLEIADKLQVVPS